MQVLRRPPELAEVIGKVASSIPDLIARIGSLDLGCLVTRKILTARTQDFWMSTPTWDATPRSR
jgi:hypothetical protein